MSSQKREHFVLIKKAGFNAQQELVSATEGATLLLNHKMWPLWEKTRCQNMVQPGHQVLVYLAGDESDCKHVIAKAIVKDVVPWTHTHKNTYPLLLDGIPKRVLLLDEVHMLASPIDIRQSLSLLSFMPANKQKWGMAMMGGMRSISEADFHVLTGSTAI